MSSLITRLIPTGAPVLNLICLEIILAKPRSVWFLGPFLAVLIFYSVLLLSGSKLNKRFWRFLISPFLFILSSLLFFIFLVLASSFFKQVLILLVSLVLFIVLENIYQFFYERLGFFNYSLENIFNYLNLLTIFLFFSGVYSASIFLQVPVGLPFAAVVLVAALISYQNLWVLQALREDFKKSDHLDFLSQKVAYLIRQNRLKSVVYVLVPTLLLVEAFWVVSFLPTSFYVNSVFLTLTYYEVASLVKARFQERLTKGLVRGYLAIGVLSLVIVLFTARW